MFVVLAIKKLALSAISFPWVNNIKNGYATSGQFLEDINPNLAPPDITINYPSLQCLHPVLQWTQLPRQFHNVITYADQPCPRYSFYGPIRLERKSTSSFIQGHLVHITLRTYFRWNNVPHIPLLLVRLLPMSVDSQPKFINNRRSLQKYGIWSRSVFQTAERLLFLLDRVQRYPVSYFLEL